MGISLALFQVDHENVVVRGLPMLNRILQTGDLAPLRQLLKDLPFDESKQLVEYFQERVARLRKVGAPAVIIANEERRFASVRAPSPGAIDHASLEELREMLGAWCREARSVDLDKAWDLVHWYCDAARRGRLHGDWRERSAGGQPSPLDFALHGHEPYPKDNTGSPVIRTGGSPDMSSYNPPGIVTEIANALEQVSPEAWGQIDREMESIAEENRPYAGASQDRLEYAREASFVSRISIGWRRVETLGSALSSIEARCREASEYCPATSKLASTTRSEHPLATSLSVKASSIRPM